MHPEGAIILGLEKLTKYCPENGQEEKRGEGRGMKPIVRLMAYAVAKGRSRKELADDTGYTFGEIQRMTQEKRFLEEVARFVEEEGEDYAERMLAGAEVDSVATLIQLRDDVGTHPSIRFSAAKLIIERVKGMATQRIITEKKQTLEPLDEMATLDAQLLQLREQSKKHTVNGHQNTSITLGTTDEP